MFKSKLQELCHQRSWSLPEYAAAKEGPDHMPRFTGTVSVNGRSFQTPNPCRSSKEAQNEAARLAFDHLTAPWTPPREPPRVAPPPPPTSGDGSGDAAGTGASSENIMKRHIFASFETVQPKLPETNEIAKVAESHLLANLEKEQPKLPESNEISKAAESSSVASDNTTVKDMRHLYKNQLQTFAQKRSLALPIYSSEHEGPPHARRFRCKVSIDGRTYETVEFYNTSKEAEHAAARIALMSLSSDTFQEVDCGLYKSLLQEFTQKQGHCLPVYDTVRCGDSHIPVFVSTVEIEGESFKGQEASTKKMAETSAAKVAYTILKERTSGKISVSSPSQSPVLQREKAAFSSYCSPADDSTGYQQKVTTGPTPKVISNYSGSDGKQIDDNGKISVSSTSQSPVLQREKAAFSSYCSPADDSTGYQQKVTTGPTPKVISNYSGSDGKQIDDNGKISVSSSSQSPVLQREKAALSSYCSPADDSTGYQQKVTTGPTPKVISNHSGSDGKQIDDNENVEASNHNLPGPSSGLDKFIRGSTDQFIPNMSNAGLRNLSLAVPSSSEDASSSSSSLPHSTDVVIDSAVQPPAELIGLLNNVVRVYPRSSNMTFPEERIVLSDENWVAVNADPRCDISMGDVNFFRSWSPGINEGGQEHKKDGLVVDHGPKEEKLPEQDKEEEAVGSNEESQQNKKRKT